MSSKIFIFLHLFLSLPPPRPENTFSPLVKHFFSSRPLAPLSPLRNPSQSHQALNLIPFSFSPQSHLLPSRDWRTPHAHTPNPRPQSSLPLNLPTRSLPRLAKKSSEILRQAGLTIAKNPFTLVRVSKRRSRTLSSKPQGAGRDARLARASPSPFKALFQIPLRH